MAQKIYKVICDNPDCGKEFERIAKHYNKKHVGKRFCSRKCTADYNADKPEIHNSRYEKVRTAFEAKAALWLPIYEQYAKDGYVVLCEKLGGVSPRYAYDFRFKMVEKGYIVPKIKVIIVSNHVRYKLPIRTKKDNPIVEPKPKVIKPPKPKPVKYVEKNPTKVNRPQPHKQDAPNPTKIKDFSTGYKYVKIDSRTYKQVKIA